MRERHPFCRMTCYPLTAAARVRFFMLCIKLSGCCIKPLCWYQPEVEGESQYRKEASPPPIMHFLTLSQSFCLVWTLFLIVPLNTPLKIYILPVLRWQTIEKVTSIFHVCYQCCVRALSIPKLLSQWSAPPCSSTVTEAMCLALIINPMIINQHSLLTSITPTVILLVFRDRYLSHHCYHLSV